jgi:hypothetical protein
MEEFGYFLDQSESKKLALFIVDPEKRVCISSNWAIEEFRRYQPILLGMQEIEINPLVINYSFSISHSWIILIRDYASTGLMYDFLKLLDDL